MSYPADDQNGVTSEKGFWKPHKKIQQSIEMREEVKGSTRRRREEPHGCRAQDTTARRKQPSS